MPILTSKEWNKNLAKTKTKKKKKKRLILMFIPPT